MGSLQTIAKVVNDSAVCNHSQLVSTEDGTTLVPTYDWTDYFAPNMSKISGIKKMHHFRFTSSEPGIVYTKLQCDTPEKRMVIAKDDWAPDPSVLPSVVTPKGLSADRQWYLFNKIREFCPEGDRDVTCPEPTVPRPTSRAGTPEEDDDDNHAPSIPLSSAAPTASSSSRSSQSRPRRQSTDCSSDPPAKKRRVCGTCGKEGHNRRTCPDQPL